MSFPHGFWVWASSLSLGSIKRCFDNPSKDQIRVMLPTPCTKSRRPILLPSSMLTINIMTEDILKRRNSRNIRRHRSLQRTDSAEVVLAIDEPSLQPISQSINQRPAHPSINQPPTHPSINGPPTHPHPHPRRN